VTDAVDLLANVTVRMFNMSVENSKRGTGLGIDFFVGGGEEGGWRFREVVRTGIGAAELHCKRLDLCSSLLLRNARSRPHASCLATSPAPQTTARC